MGAAVTRRRFAPIPTSRDGWYFHARRCGHEYFVKPTVWVDQVDYPNGLGREVTESSTAYHAVKVTGTERHLRLRGAIKEVTSGRFRITSR